MDGVSRDPSDFGRELKAALAAASGTEGPEGDKPGSSYRHPSGRPFVFLGYAHETMQEAAGLVTALEAEGIPMFWDQLLEPGDDLDDALQAALEAAVAIIIVWSEPGLGSSNMKAEAAFAFERGNAIPVRVDGFSPEQLPYRFRGKWCSPIGDVDRIVKALRKKGL